MGTGSFICLDFEDIDAYFYTLNGQFPYVFVISIVLHLGVQFNKETTSVHVLQVGVLFLRSHKFEFNQNLYKILLQASNLYLHWYFIEFNLYELKLYVCTLQLQKSTHEKRLPDWATFAMRFMVHSNKLFPQNKGIMHSFCSVHVTWKHQSERK